ncbi:MAG: winged helix-turn-helix domain-containing protein [Nitrososphaerales archaeon]|jgi:predicted transcriptional regulator
MSLRGHPKNAERSKPRPSRSELEIKVHVLRAVAGGLPHPAQIRFKASISSAALQRNLPSLVKGGLLSEGGTSKRRVYTITPKGVEFLLLCYGKGDGTP